MTDFAGLTPRAHRVVETALAAAREDGHPCGTDYLLWAMLQESEGPHRRVMTAMERGEADGARELRRWLRAKREVMDGAAGAAAEQLVLPDTVSSDDLVMHPKPPADFWRPVPCGHPPDPLALQLEAGWTCHCGAVLEAKNALPADVTPPWAPGPLVPCFGCGCTVALTEQKDQ